MRYVIAGVEFKVNTFFDYKDGKNSSCSPLRNNYQATRMGVKEELSVRTGSDFYSNYWDIESPNFSGEDNKAFMYSLKASKSLSRSLIMTYISSCVTSE